MGAGECGFLFILTERYFDENQSGHPMGWEASSPALLLAEKGASV